MNKTLPDISESVEQLQHLMRHESDGSKKQRLNALYLIVSQQAKNRTQVASLLGVHRMTVGRWFAAYRKGGLNGLLEIKKPPGRVALITVDIQAGIKERLADSNGFKSYVEIQQFIADEYDLDISYKAVHKLVYYKLKAKLKVPRKSHKKKDRRKSITSSRSSLTL
jgi:transposase